MNNQERLVELGSAVVGALASQTAEVQAAFFNEFMRRLKVICHGDHDRQLAYIGDYLDTNGCELADSLAAYAKLAQEARVKLGFDMQELYRQRHELEKEIEEKRQARATLEKLQALEQRQ